MKAIASALIILSAAGCVTTAATPPDVGNFRGQASQPILAKLGPPGRPAVTAATDSPKKELRVKAIESLGRIKPVEKASLDKLMSLLDDKEYDIRKAALLGIKATEKEGAAATTRLMAVLNDTKEDETIRSLAKDALKSVDPRKGLMGADKPK